MSLTNLHTSANYQDELHIFLKQVEGFNNGLPYFDAAGNTALVTIGIGANIDTVSKYLEYVLTELGINGVVSEIDSTKTANQLIKDTMDSVPNGSANNGDGALQDALNQVLRENFPSRFGPTSEFKLTETQAYTVLDKIIVDKKTVLDGWLTEYNIDVSSLQGTKEYMVLTSLFYNREIVAKTDSAGNIIRDAQGRRIPTSNSLIGPKLLAALEYDNRAEAWFEIRYNSNGGNSASQGIANRRYSEADDFGLRDSGTLTQDQEIAQAKEIMRMWTRHKDTITQYESSGKYPPPTDVGTGAQYVELSALELEYEFAPNSIIDGEVIVGAGLDTYAYLEKTNINDTLNGTNQNDLIFGEKGNDTIMGNGGSDVIYGGEGNDQLLGVDGNDTIYGETGNDTIYGGTGNDVMIGGTGIDTYIFKTGDGQDTITDLDGIGSIIYDGKAVTLGLHKNSDSADTWYGQNGEIFTKSGSDLIITKTGPALDSITIKDYFTIAAPPLLAANQPPLGIKLTTETGYINGLPTQTITGTAGADTIALLPSGYNYIIYGGEGNDSIDPPGNDIIYGEGGNDMIYGGTGDDRLFGGIGDDLLVGDNAQVYTSPEGQQYNTIDGKDYIEGNEGNDLIMGGFMDDILMGGTGDDTIYGEYDAQYAGKDPVPDTSQDDYIDGGEGNDTIFGNLGNDTMLGGSGDDFISGDIDYYTDSNGNIIPLQPGSDIIDGGDGNDTLDGRGSIML